MDKQQQVTQHEITQQGVYGQPEPPKMIDWRAVISKVTAAILIMIATFIGTSTASKSYVNDTFENKIIPLKTQLDQINKNLIQIKKDSCYARQNLARLTGDPIKDCASDS